MNLDSKALNDTAGGDAMAKKSYETPRLQIYGGLGDVVRSVAGMNNMDGATGSLNRTS